MTGGDWDRLAQALDYPAAGSPPLREDYVRTFDLDPDCSLEMGWHLWGERPERAIFMAALRDDLVRAGISEAGNLPDYLPTLLRLIGRQDPCEGAALAATIAPAAARVLERVRAKQSGFAEAIEAAVRALEASRAEEART